MTRRFTMLPRICTVTTLALLVLVPTALARMAQPFEGTKWKVTVTPDDQAASAGEKEFTTILEFKGGKFSSSECVKAGYKPIEYKEEMAPGGLAATFTAEPISEKEGKEKWHGNATAGEMNGELTVTKKDGTVLNFSFKGERMAK
jgi:hypothetical protein